MFYQKSFISIVSLLLLSSVLFGCDQPEEKKDTAVKQSSSAENKSTIKKKGSRILGFSINETEGVTFGSAYNQAIEIGSQMMTLPLPWDEVEKKPGKYKNPLLAIGNEFYPTNNLSLSLELNPIDTNNLRLPKDLKGRKFNNKQLANRYKNALKWCLAQLKDTNITCIVVGNEVDGYLNSNVLWQDYLEFFKDVKAYANKLKPGVPVGAKIMASSILVDGNDGATELAKACDVVMLTYYPIKGDFTVKEPESINNTFEKLARVFPEKQVYFLELGYPSSPEIDSSNEKQAKFIENAFKAWDKNSETVKLVNFVWMNDIPDSQLKKYSKYYKVKDSNFISFLGSLGLCSVVGTKKPGYDQLKKEANTRGW